MAYGPLDILRSGFWEYTTYICRNKGKINLEISDFIV